MAKQKSKKFIVWGAIIIVVLVAVLLWWKSERQTEIGKVTHFKIAVNMPLTGNLSIFGVPLREGFQMARDEAISNGLIKPNEILIDFQDNQGSQAMGVTVWNKQKPENPDVYVSGVGINTKVFNDQVEEANIPHVIFGWVASLSKGRSNTIRLWLHYKLEVREYLKYINFIKSKRIAIVYANYAPYVELVNDYLVPNLNPEVETIIEAFEPGTKDFKTIALKVKKFEPDLIIFDAFPHEFSGLVNDFRTYDLIKSGNFLGTMDFIDAPLFLSADRLEGIVFPAPQFIAKPNDPIIISWKKKFKEIFNKEPSYTAAYAYDLFNLFLNTYKQHPSASGLTLVKIMRESKTVGITGDIKFDKDGDLDAEMYLLQYKNGNTEIIK